jgi:hypothetical protein
MWRWFVLVAFASSLGSLGCSWAQGSMTSEDCLAAVTEQLQKKINNRWASLNIRDSKIVIVKNKDANITIGLKLSPITTELHSVANGVSIVDNLIANLKGSGICKDEEIKAIFDQPDLKLDLSEFSLPLTTGRVFTAKLPTSPSPPLAPSVSLPRTPSDDPQSKEGKAQKADAQNESNQGGQVDANNPAESQSGFWGAALPISTVFVNFMICFGIAIAAWALITRPFLPRLGNKILGPQAQPSVEGQEGVELSLRLSALQEAVRNMQGGMLNKAELQAHFNEFHELISGLNGETRRAIEQCASTIRSLFDGLISNIGQESQSSRTALIRDVSAEIGKIIDSLPIVVRRERNESVTAILREINDKSTFGYGPKPNVPVPDRTPLYTSVPEHTNLSLPPRLGSSFEKTVIEGYIAAVRLGTLEGEFTKDFGVEWLEGGETFLESGVPRSRIGLLRHSDLGGKILILPKSSKVLGLDSDIDLYEKLFDISKEYIPLEQNPLKELPACKEIVGGVTRALTLVKKGRWVSRLS